MENTPDSKKVDMLQWYLENTSIGAIMWDLDCKVVSWNNACKKIFGYTSEEALGKQAWELMVPESERESIEEERHNLLNGQEYTPTVTKNLTKEGGTVYCEWDNKALRDEAGNITGLSSLITNVTAQYEAMDSLKKFNEVAIDREMKMIELKQRIEELEQKLAEKEV